MMNDETKTPGMKIAVAGAMLCLLSATAALGQTRAQYEKSRKRLVEQILVPSGIKDPKVLKVMLATPRHEFIPLAQRQLAYFDMGLPIGASQTISSPFIVAYMTESIDPQPDDKVLEIGTGSGYQAAILSPLVKEVYTIEIVDLLGRRAARTLRRLRYGNVFTKIGDGYKGWPEHAPFDKIIVTCSPEDVPKPLVEQLKEGGLMVVPVGERYQQTLYLFTKKDGRLQSKALRPTLFVPMTGKAESSRDVKPDPLNPSVVNGSFEEPALDNGQIPGWYYQRQLTCETDKRSPEGTHHVRFHNKEPGRNSNALQGFAIDGRKVTGLTISAHVKVENVLPGRERTDLPAIMVTFYDEDRRDLGRWWLGPWRGTDDWHRVEKTIRVPSVAREGILRIGLFGATGAVCFDDLRMKAAK